MLVTMDMCAAKPDSDYAAEVMCAGWNPEIAMMQDRAAVLAAQLIHRQSPRAVAMPGEMAEVDVEAFLERMYAAQS